MYKSYVKFMNVYLCIEGDNEYIYGINFVDELLDEYCSCDLTNEAARELEEYFKGTRKRFSIPFIFKGTKFQEEVWKALLEIPYGNVLSYKELAEKISRPKAYRAVGTAVSKNNLSIVVPCHRIIKSTGETGNYGGGRDTKIKLLKIEKYLQ